MGSVFLEKGIDVKHSYPIIGKITNLYPSIFRDDRDTLSKAFFYFRITEQALISFGILRFSYIALKNAPLNATAFLTGMALGSVTYAGVSLLRDRVLRDSKGVPYTGLLTTVYLYGVTMLNKKWQVIESLTWSVTALALLKCGHTALRRSPVFVATVTSFGVGAALSHVAFDLFYRGMKFVPQA